MNALAFLLGVGQAVIAGLWLNEIGASVIVIVSIAIPVGYSWYRIAGGER